jgi:hypothetical protein
MKEINNILLDKESPEFIDFDHIDFKDNKLIEYIDIKGIKHLIKNDGLPLGVI